MIYTTASTLAFLWRLMLSNTSQHSCKLVKICVGITVGCDKTVVFVALGMITGWFVSMLWSSLSMCNTGSPSGRPWGLMASHCYAVTKIKLFYVLGSFFKYETFNFSPALQLLCDSEEHLTLWKIFSAETFQGWNYCLCDLCLHTEDFSKRSSNNSTCDKLQAPSWGIMLTFSKTSTDISVSGAFKSSGVFFIYASTRAGR